jgi:hypothetical protein
LERRELLDEMISSGVVARDGVIRPERMNELQRKKLVAFIAKQIKVLGKFSCLFGECKYPDFAKCTSMILPGKPIVFYPEGDLTVPVLSKFRNNSIAIIKIFIEEGDVKKVIDFSRSIEGEPVGRVVLATLFDLRRIKIYDPGIEIVSVFNNRSDFIF